MSVKVVVLLNCGHRDIIFLTKPGAKVKTGSKRFCMACGDIQTVKDIQN